MGPLLAKRGGWGPRVVNNRYTHYPHPPHLGYPTEEWPIKGTQWVWRTGSNELLRSLGKSEIDFMDPTMIFLKTIPSTHKNQEPTKPVDTHFLSLSFFLSSSSAKHHV